ncbi:cytochrome P450 [Catenulispora sp. GP43]|uniref:cytochrome P450 n=1 Tax=Catenulispora sp. GP43 TaxID=3156263 RepID=UPI003514C24B
MSQILAPRFDPLDPEVQQDPYPTYARLRESGALCRGGPAQWVVTRYADVMELVRDPRLGSEYDADYHRIALGPGPLADFFGRIVLNRDPPGHTVLRRLIGQAFTPLAVRERGATIAEIVERALAPARDGARLDGVADLAHVLPIRVLADFVGLEPGCLDEVRPRALALSRAFATFLPEADRPAAHDAVSWLRTLVVDLFERRRRAPRDDLVSRLVSSRVCGPGAPDFDDLVDNVVFLLFAGFATTTDLLATGCAALLAHPGELVRLRADPALVPSAVEEFLRYDAPVQVKSRLTREPVEVAGRTIRAGRILVLLIGSANRDPARFPDPDRLDVGRDPNPHLSFGGGGIHHCVGAALARAEAVAVFGRLVRGFADVRPDGPAIRRPSPSFRGYASVPMLLTPA